MPCETLGKWDVNSPDLQRDSIFKFVGIPSVPYSHYLSPGQVSLSAICLRQQELGQFQVSRRSDLDIASRPHHHPHFRSQTLNQRSLVGSNEAISRGAVERLFD